MKPRTNEVVFSLLHVLSWIFFIGLCIEAGVLIFNFLFTFFNPIASHNIYKGLDLSNIYENQFPHYIGLMGFVVVLAVLKAYIFYLVVQICLKLNLVKPFDCKIAKLIEKLSFEAMAIAVLSFIAHLYTEHFIPDGFEVSDVENYWDDGAAFLMMAAILLVISHVFRRGIALQNENDLTV